MMMIMMTISNEYASISFNRDGLLGVLLFETDLTEQCFFISSDSNCFILSILILFGFTPLHMNQSAFSLSVFFLCVEKSSDFFFISVSFQRPKHI